MKYRESDTIQNSWPCRECVIPSLTEKSQKLCREFSISMRRLLNRCDGDEQVSVVLAPMIEYDIDPIAYAKDFLTDDFLGNKWN